jgi:serine/threonine protein kinase
MKLLGSGPNSSVWRVIHKASRKLYTLKKIDTRQLPSRKQTDFFMNYLVNISNPVLVNYLDYFFEDDNLFILMEYANKDSLYTLINPIKGECPSFNEKVCLCF